MNREFIEKAQAAKSPEELAALARENNIELTEEQAKEYYDRLHSGSELVDDELDMVAGGCSELKDSPKQSEIERLRSKRILR